MEICIRMVFLVGLEQLLVVWSLEKVYGVYGARGVHGAHGVHGGEEEELAMILVVKEEEGASPPVEAWHMEQELVWEEVEICTCMVEKLAPP